MSIQLLAEMATGALVGYCTNDLAIRSLFEKNGVIEKTREQFSREIGNLLEAQVLTGQVLQEQLQKPEVQQGIVKALGAFLEQELPSVLAGQNLGDLPDWQQTVDTGKQVLLHQLEQQGASLETLLRKYGPLDQVLTGHQQEMLARQLQSQLMLVLEQEPLVENLYRQWWLQKGQMTLGQLELASICEKALSNIASQCNHMAAQFIHDNRLQVEQCCRATVASLGLELVLEGLEQQLQRTTWGQVVDVANPQLQAWLISLLDSQEGEALLQQMADQLLAQAMELNKPVAELLPQELLGQLQPLLTQTVPSLLDGLMEWLESNKKSVTTMLEDAVEEIALEAGGMTAMLLNQLKDGLLQRMLEQTDMTQWISQLLQQQPEQMVGWLEQQIGAYLSTHSLGQIIAVFNQKGFLQQLTVRNLKASLTQPARLEQWLNSAYIGPVHLKAYQSQLEDWCVGTLMTWLEQVDWAQLAAQQKEALRDVPVEHLLPEDSYWLETLLVHSMPGFCRQLVDTMIQRPELLYQALLEGARKAIGGLDEKKLGQYTLGQCYQLVEPWLSSQKALLVETQGPVVLKRLQGYLSGLTQNQINSLTTLELLQLVREFMGRELRPLNYLGAGMGAIAGAGLGLVMTGGAMPEDFLSHMAIYGGTYGFVGYATNCAAVKGLFWPYRPVAGIQALQGVIPKQRQRFASSMGQLLDRYVIGQDRLSQLLEQQHSQWQSYTTELAKQHILSQYLGITLAERRKQLLPLATAWLFQQEGQPLEAWLLKLGQQSLGHLLPEAPEVSWEPAVEDFCRQITLPQELTLGQLSTGVQVGQWGAQWLSQQSLPALDYWREQLNQQEKSLSQLLNPEQQQWCRQWLAQKTTSGALTDWLAGMVDDSAVKGWLSRESSQWVQENLGWIFTYVEQAIVQAFQQRQEALTGLLQQEIVSRLGFMQQMGYAMMGGDQIVADIVDRVLHQKLPILLSVKSQSLKELLLRWWQADVLPVCGELQLPARPLEPVLRACLREQVVQQAMEGAVTLVLHQPICQWAPLVQLEQVVDIPYLQLQFQWQQQRQQVGAVWAPVIGAFYEDRLAQQRLYDLTSGAIAGVNWKTVLWCQALEPELQHGMEQMLQQLSQTHLQDWLDWPELTTAVREGLQHWMEGPGVQALLSYTAQQLALQLSEHSAVLLSQDCQEKLWQLLEEAFMATLQLHGSAVLEAFQLKGLTSAQIEQMDAAHLEQVIRSFANPYFGHVERRGWFGAIVAPLTQLLSWLG